MDISKNSRVETLDYLRGLMALSIMFYHLTIFTYHALDMTNPLGRLGVYAVSIFFIISGLSMAIVYNSYIKSVRTSVNFYIRRIFRIWPLLWVICILTILPHIVKTGKYDDWGLLFINFTTLFGFIKPTAYIVTGGWSLGNEMVYYALTPLIFVLYNYRKWAGNILLLICTVVGIVFAFRLLDPKINLFDQWYIYANPFNNLFLYVAGIALYYNFKDLKIKQSLNQILLVLAVVLFCILPFGGDRISIVTGLGRVIFVVLALVIVFCFYKLEIELPQILSSTFEKFGLMTYSVYLIHPVVFTYTKHFLTVVDLKYRILLFTMVAVITLVISIYSFKLFELKWIKIGKNLTSSPVRREKRAKVV